MIESVSCNELYEKFHELYIAVIKHIINKITLTKTLTKKDGTIIDSEMLERVQEYCLAVFDELNYCMYRRALEKVPEEMSPLAVLTYTLSTIEDKELMPIIQEKYKDKLTEEEFNMLGELFEIVSEQLYGILSLSCKFLVSTHDIKL